LGKSHNFAGEYLERTKNENLEDRDLDILKQVVQEWTSYW